MANTVLTVNYQVSRTKLMYFNVFEIIMLTLIRLMIVLVTHNGSLWQCIEDESKMINWDACKQAMGPSKKTMAQVYE